MFSLSAASIAVSVAGFACYVRGLLGREHSSAARRSVWSARALDGALKPNRLGLGESLGQVLTGLTYCPSVIQQVFPLTETLGAPMNLPYADADDAVIRGAVLVRSPLDATP